MIPHVRKRKAPTTAPVNEALSPNRKNRAVESQQTPQIVELEEEASETVELEARTPETLRVDGNGKKSEKKIQQLQEALSQFRELYKVSQQELATLKQQKNELDEVLKEKEKLIREYELKLNECKFTMVLGLYQLKLLGHKVVVFTNDPDFGAEADEGDWEYEPNNETEANCLTEPVDKVVDENDDETYGRHHLNEDEAMPGLTCEIPSGEIPHVPEEVSTETSDSGPRRSSRVRSRSYRYSPSPTP